MELGQFIDALKVAPADAEAARDKSWEDMDVLDNKDFRERLSAIETNVERTNRLLEAALHPMTKN